VTFAPWRIAPDSPKTPTTSPARITEMAFAPTAGANGVDPEEPAPIDHAIKRLAVAATPRVATVATTMLLLPVLVPFAEPGEGAPDEEEREEEEHEEAGKNDDKQRFDREHTPESVGTVLGVSAAGSHGISGTGGGRRPTDD